MSMFINHLKGLFGSSATLDENQIVANICQHIKASVVQLKYNMVFDAYNDVLLAEDIYDKVKSNFDVIYVDARNISFEYLQKIARHYHPYRPHCENFTIQFSSFKEGDDLSDIVGANDDSAGMYIASRRQENASGLENAEKRITKISKMSRVLDAYSMKMARDYGFEIKSSHRFSAPLDGFKILTNSAINNTQDTKKEAWGKLNALGSARFEGGHRAVGLYHNPVRIGGSDTPLEKNGVVGYRLEAGNIPYAVISKEGESFFISGTGLMNGTFHLAPDVRKPLPDGAKILLGDQEVMFTSSSV